MGAHWHQGFLTFSQVDKRKRFAKKNKTFNDTFPQVDEDLFALNVFSVVNLTRVVLPHMLQRWDFVQNLIFFQCIIYSVFMCNIFINVISCDCNQRLSFWIWYIFIGRALSSQPTPYQVLKTKSWKTTDFENDNEYTGLSPTSLSLSCIVWENIAAGHHHEESTILGKIPLKEQAPVAWNQTFCAKIKVLLPLHLHPSQAPPAGISTLLLMVLKKSWEDLHPGKIFKNYLPTSCIASSQLGRLPSRFSCSLGPDLWNLRSGPSP